MGGPALCKEKSRLKSFRVSVQGLYTVTIYY